MDIIELLEYLQEVISTSSKIPVTGKVVINKKEVLDIIEQVINNLPEQFKKAQWIVEEKQKIINDAKEEAELIRKESIEEIKKKIDNNDITKEARIKAQGIISSAQKDAKNMRLSARDYADEILCQLQMEIDSEGKLMLNNVKNEVEKFMESLNGEVSSTSNSIKQNIKELRNLK
ncbi:MAG: ATPase [Bacillota bacterium]|nr:ATPase [Bacillota bacterium]